MRLHRFYISNKVGAQTELEINDSELVNQVTRVFRAKRGDHVKVFDGSGSDYTCLIEDWDKKSIKLAVTESEASRFMPTRRVILCAALVKKDNFEWVVEKATELGVTEIIPIIAERTEKKAVNPSRLQKIAIEASEQSGRGSIPIISTISTLKDAVSQLKEREKANDLEFIYLAFHTEGENLRGELPKDKDVVIFIGPEGGWSPEEADYFANNQIAVQTLGKQVLRSETAVIAALSKVIL